MTSSTQPDWYDDPDDASAQRYWDGQTWTPHRRRKPPSQQSPAPPPPTSVPAPAAPSEFPPPSQPAPPIPPPPQQPPPPEPPQAAGQYGQPPPGQWTPPSAQVPPVTAKAGGSGGKVLLAVAAVVAVLIVGAVVVLLKSGVFNRETKKLAVAEVQTQVQKVLVDRVTGYTSSDITNVACNNGQDPTVKQGGSFTCNVTDRGKQHRLTVKFLDGSGTYEVGLPQLSGGK